MSFFGQSPQQRFFTPLRSVLNDKKPTIATVAIPFFLSKLQGCGLRFGRKSPLQYAVGGIPGATATCNPQLGLRFHFRWFSEGITTFCGGQSVVFRWTIRRGAGYFYILLNNICYYSLGIIQ